MFRLVVVVLTALTLMSGATLARAQDEEPCPATEPGAGTAVAMASPDGSPTRAATASPTGSPTGSPPAAAGCAVTIMNFAFEPKDITIPVGTTVTWTNMDEEQLHTATARVTDPGTGQPLFNIVMPNQLPGQHDSGPHTFDTPGAIPYRCEEHPTLMMGTITVE
jgi:plastocyanin